MKKLLAVVVVAGVVGVGAYLYVNNSQSAGLAAVAATKAGYPFTFETTIKSISSNGFTVAGGAYLSYFINTSSAKLVRNNDGASTLGEFEVGDWVNVSGNYASNVVYNPKSTTPTTINITAKNVKDISLSYDGYWRPGTASNFSASGFTLVTASKTFHVITAGGTSVNAFGKQITYSLMPANIKSNSKVDTFSVDGPVDAANNTIIAWHIKIAAK